ncbi:signal peptidase I [Paractinoplanes rhizophilus]|uniref:Signal peptidase I n=1 Tax=Paractinoplanes rhizophilus TaxID=1416877 RepID=A0ABW2HPL3_9ACTN|nr:signal peptidase I [Actinoplanes sp.]
MIDEQTAKRKGSFWRELPILLGVAILVAVLVRAFVLQTFYIPSPSMEHTLNVLDRVLVNKLVYDFRDPRRGEIIVFKAPEIWQSGAEGEDFIKRIIGTPGDRVMCCDDQDRLVINGHSLDEPYIYHDADGNQDPAADRKFEITVPKDRLWVMGDHRSASGDSLEHYEDSEGDIQQATIPEDSVIGRAFTVFWPVSRAKWLSVPDGYADIPDSTAAK